MEFNLSELSIMLGIPPEKNIEDLKVIIKGVNNDVLVEDSFKNVFEPLLKIPIDLNKVRLEKLVHDSVKPIAKPLEKGSKISRKNIM